MATALSLATFFKDKRDKYHDEFMTEFLQDLCEKCQTIAVNILESFDSDRLAFMALEAVNEKSKRSALTIALDESLNGVFIYSLMRNPELIR